LLSKSKSSLSTKKIHFDLKGTDLRRLIREFIAKNGVTKDSRQNRLLIYYSGHGETLNGAGYLVPVDAPGKSKAAEFYLRAIPITDVQTWNGYIVRRDAPFILLNVSLRNGYYDQPR
jgi:hypothetical protein